jgi:hypothetical protein
MKLVVFAGVDSSLGVAIASSPLIVAGDRLTQVFNVSNLGDETSRFMSVCPGDGIIVQPGGFDLSANTYLGVVLP